MRAVAVTDETREARPAKRANRIVRKMYREGTVELGDDIRVRRWRSGQLCVPLFDLFASTQTNFRIYRLGRLLTTS